jgi:hypothetical protein
MAPRRGDRVLRLGQRQPGVPDSLLGHGRWAAEPGGAGAAGGEAFVGVLRDQLADELREHGEGQPAARVVVTASWSDVQPIPRLQSPVTMEIFLRRWRLVAALVFWLGFHLFTWLCIGIPFLPTVIFLTAFVPWEKVREGEGLGTRYAGAGANGPGAAAAGPRPASAGA